MRKEPVRADFECFRIAGARSAEQSVVSQHSEKIRELRSSVFGVAEGFSSMEKKGI